ncbi:hypothetical protein EYF80_036240 [Liparis tanakae]|uniref:Uncharacterized protein n=1 Tax=Liparis tanakae TaxID=230148 RepID=A0A4Z2GJX2_9TELE|nr:hypothetical protein EYF80_036240 [Liparis tanakae]
MESGSRGARVTAASSACEHEAYLMMPGRSSRNSQEARSLFPTERWKRKDLTRLALEVAFSTCLRVGTHLCGLLLVGAEFPGLHFDPLQLLKVTLVNIEVRDHGYRRVGGPQAAEKLDRHRPPGSLRLLHHPVSAQLRMAVLEVLVQPGAEVPAARDRTRGQADVDPSGGHVQQEPPLIQIQNQMSPPEVLC